MSAESKPHLQLEIGHVLFIDIVGYSKLLINEQSEVLHELNDLVRATERVRAADAAGKLIRLPAGDGMALVFRDSPEGPAECALEIAQALKSHPEVQVRMGIHSGPVNEIVDVNERSNIAGAGINIAQRVMDCGDAGHILVSKRVAEDLGQYRHWQPLLHELGECEVKHGAVIALSNLYTEELGNPNRPAKYREANGTGAAVIPSTVVGSIVRGPARGLLAGLALLFLLVAVGVFIFSRTKTFQSRRGAEAAPTTSHSIAVLPFENEATIRTPSICRREFLRR